MFHEKNPSQFSAEKEENMQRWIFIRTNSRVRRASCPRGKRFTPIKQSVQHLFQMTFDWRAARRAPAIHAHPEVLRRVLGDPDPIIRSFFSNLKQRRRRMNTSFLSTFKLMHTNAIPENLLLLLELILAAGLW